MTKDKFPTGYHIYIIEDNGLYKIGYTKNLKNRLQVYNTGRANKCEYLYYKKTECAKEIELCMKAFLNKYIYKSNKEFYDCSEKIIIDVINKCLKIENNCNKCREIYNSINNKLDKFDVSQSIKT
jgi:predicted GIY-YIG superfamily endonuclease